MRITMIAAEVTDERSGSQRIRLVVGGGVAEKPDAQVINLLRDAHAAREALMSGRDETKATKAVRV